MFLQSKSPVLSRELVQAMLTALKTDPGAVLLLTPFVHLFTAVTGAITPDMVPADFTEAAFTGYAPVSMTPINGPSTINANTLAMYSAAGFTGGAVTPPGEVILGYYVTDDDTAPTKIYMAEQFAESVAIAAEGDFLSLDLIFPANMALSL
jgi:hypothetical protein